MKKLFVSLKNNIDYVKEALNENKELVVREVFCGKKKAVVFYINEQVNEPVIQKYIILPMQKNRIDVTDMQMLQKKVVVMGETKLQTDLEECVNEIVKGNTVVILEKEQIALVCTTVFPQQRSVQEPPTSAVIYGPREGFVENIKTNLSLIRKRLPTTELKIEELTIGKYTKTKIEICYLNDIADKKIVEKNF